MAVWVYRFQESKLLRKPLWKTISHNGHQLPRNGRWLTQCLADIPRPLSSGNRVNEVWLQKRHPPSPWWLSLWDGLTGFTGLSVCETESKNTDRAFKGSCQGQSSPRTFWKYAQQFVLVMLLIQIGLQFMLVGFHFRQIRKTWKAGSAFGERVAVGATMGDALCDSSDVL